MKNEVEVKINRHNLDFGSATLEFDVKGIMPNDIPIDIAEYEQETGAFANNYSQECFDKCVKAFDSTLKRLLRGKKFAERWEYEEAWRLDDWSFAGRSCGWYAITLNKRGYWEPETKQDWLLIEAVSKVVNKYIENYSKRLYKFYKI